MTSADDRRRERERRERELVEGGRKKASRDDAPPPVNDPTGTIKENYRKDSGETKKGGKQKG